jgi:hypothetical protein
VRRYIQYIHIPLSVGQEGSQADQEAGMCSDSIPDLSLDQAAYILNLQLGTLLRSKRKVEELQGVIQETRRH